MTAQIVEIAGHKMAVLPVEEYERLLETVEDKADILATEDAERRLSEGEEYVPAELIDRILSGESPLRVWRQYRGMTLEELAELVGVAPATISRIETGKMNARPALWKSLSDALNVTVADVFPVA